MSVELFPAHADKEGAPVSWKGDSVPHKQHHQGLGDMQRIFLTLLLCSLPFALIILLNPLASSKLRTALVRIELGRSNKVTLASLARKYGAPTHLLVRDGREVAIYSSPSSDGRASGLELAIDENGSVIGFREIRSRSPDFKALGMTEKQR